MPLPAKNDTSRVLYCLGSTHRVGFSKVMNKLVRDHDQAGHTSIAIYVLITCQVL